MALVNFMNESSEMYNELNEGKVKEILYDDDDIIDREQGSYLLSKNKRKKKPKPKNRYDYNTDPEFYKTEDETMYKKMEEER